MSELSNLRLHVHNTYSVKEDGTQGELLEETVRVSDVIEGKAFASVEDALASVDGTEEGQIVKTKESSPELAAQEAVSPTPVVEQTSTTETTESDPASEAPVS